MASSSKLRQISLCIMSLLLLSLHVGGHLLRDIEEATARAGLISMSLALKLTLSDLLSAASRDYNTTQLTIFSPPDEAYLGHGQASMDVLKYHAVPGKLEIVDLHLGSKIDTLFVGHPLTVTTLGGAGNPSLNNVKITRQDIYNDGQVTVHEIEKFLYPNYQTIVRPNPFHSEVIPELNSSWVQYTPVTTWVLVAAVVCFFAVLGYCWFLVKRKTDVLPVSQKKKRKDW